MAFLLRRMRSLQGAEDLSQEVYLRLLRVQAPDRIRNLRAYVYRVAVNALVELKTREDSSPVEFDSDLAYRLGELNEDATRTPEEVLEAEGDEYGLEELVGTLPPMQRTVLLMAICQQVPHRDIARQLGISVNTVRNHLYRALYSCRQKLSAERPTREGAR